MLKGQKLLLELQNGPEACLASVLGIACPCARADRRGLPAHHARSDQRPQRSFNKLRIPLMKGGRKEKTANRSALPQNESEACSVLAVGALRSHLVQRSLYVRPPLHVVDPHDPHPIMRMREHLKKLNTVM